MMSRVSPSGSIHYMTAHGSFDTIGVILDIQSMISRFIIEAVEDVPASRMAEQPGTVVNHPAWTLSHLNAYAGLLLSMLDDHSVPTARAEMEQFGYGTTPVLYLAAYATKDELLDRFRDRTARLAAVIAEKHSAYFPRPSPEKFRPYSPTVGHVAITLIVTHPPHHLGQLKQWRRVAGIAGQT